MKRSLALTSCLWVLGASGCTLFGLEAPACDGDENCPSGLVCVESVCLDERPGDDGGEARDAGRQDSGPGPKDAGEADAGVDGGERPDAGPVDAGRDAGEGDAGQHDAGSEDAGSEDAGSEDAGADDAGADDAGAQDAGGEPVCAPGERRCSGLTVEECNAERTGFIPVELCEPSADCLQATCSAGVCGESVAAPGATCADGVCDPSGLCVECLGSGDCPGDRRVCALETNTCVECVSNGDCGGATPVCVDSVCAECVPDGPAQCLPPSTCSATVRSCDETGHWVESDCPAGDICTGAGVCADAPELTVGESSQLGQSNNEAPNYLVAMRVTLDCASRVQSFNVFTRTGGAANPQARFALYRDNGGTPVGGALVAASGSFSLPNGTVGTIGPSPANPRVEPGDYWLVSNFAGTAYTYRGAYTDGTVSHFADHSFGSAWPSTFPGGGGTTTVRPNYFLVVTPSP